MEVPICIHCPLQLKSVQEQFVQTSVSVRKRGWVGLFALTDFNTIEFDGQRVTCVGVEAEG